MLELNLADLRQYVERLVYRPLFVTVSGCSSLRIPLLGQRRGSPRLPSVAVAGYGGAGSAESDAGAQIRLKRHGGGTGQPRNCQIPAPVGAEQRLYFGADFLADRGRGPSVPRPSCARWPDDASLETTIIIIGDSIPRNASCWPRRSKRAKPVLYAYRVLMTGIHLLRTGEIEANLLRLNEHFGFAFLDELIARKVNGENVSVGDLDLVVRRRPTVGTRGPARFGICRVTIARRPRPKTHQRVLGVITGLTSPESHHESPRQRTASRAGVAA